MSVVAAVVPVPFRSRIAGRLAVLLALVVALVAGAMSGVARADDAGGFTPIDFAQAPPPPAVSVFAGGLTFSGSLTLDGLDPVTPQDVLDGQITFTTFRSQGRPARGEAHLFSRTSGIAPMTDAQYAGMVTMENDAVRSVMSAHGISDTPYNHDLVVGYAREDVTTALYARLQQALAKDTPLRSTDEQQALTWLVAVARAHAMGAAAEAKRQFDTWQANPCTYRAPAPYDDYVGNLAPHCQGLRSFSYFPPQDKAPSTEQFLAWGSAAYDAARSDGRTVQKSLFTSSVSEWAIAFGAAASFFGVATAAGLTANLLSTGAYGAGPLTAAVFPYFAAGIRGPSIMASLTGTPTALRTLSTAISYATRFAGIANFSVVLGPALIIASAIVTAVVAGIDAFAAKNTATALDAAIGNADYTQPDLRELLGSSAGQQQVFADLADSVVDCSPDSSGLSPGECDIDVSQPTRRVDDPVFASYDTDSGEQVGGRTVAAPVSLGRPGGWSDTQLAIRDGWFVRDDSAEPTQTFRYTDFQGKARAAHLLRRGGSYYFQSMLEPLSPDSTAGSGYDPAANCASGNIYQPCFTSTSLPMRTSSGRNVSIVMDDDRAPTAPVIGTNRPAGVGLPVLLSSSLPSNTPADPDGDTVTSTWTVEFDEPCVQTAPANPGWNCPANGATPNGPHGGYVYDLPAGKDTVVWNAPGTYRVTRTVTDPFAMSTSASMDVVVAPAAKSLFAACLKCDTSGAKPVQIAGRIGLGAHRDQETVTIDWGDGTTTSGVPSRAPGGTGFLSSTFWATIENSSQYQFQAAHDYPAGPGGPYRITVSSTDTGDGDPPPVTLAADYPPVVDPTSFEQSVDSDRLVDYPIPLRLPVFVDSTGNRPPVVCTAPEGSGTRTITDFAAFPTGTTTLVTCRATAASGVTGTASIAVRTHQITATVHPSVAVATVGQPVTYTATGVTDDGRQVGDITDRITVQSAADGVSCSVRTCSRTTTAGPIVAEPMADDNHVGDAVTTPVSAGLPASIAVAAGAGQQVPVNTTLPDGGAFVLRDAYGNPVPNTPVTVSVASGAGTLHGGATTAQALSDAHGTVQFPAAVGGTPGQVVFRATVNDDVVAQLAVTAFAGDGLRGVSGNAQRVRVGATPAPLVVRLYDGNLSPVPGQAIQVRTGRGPARFAGGGTSVSGTTDAAGRFSIPLAAAAAAGPTTFVVTSDGDSRVLTTYYVANAAPVAATASYLVTNGTGGLRPTATNGVLSGVVDPDGDPLTATLVTGTTRGALSLAADGSFLYAPRAGFAGTDSFTYTASDGLLTTTPQRVTIQVAAASADVGVVLVGPAAVTRRKAVTLGVIVTNRGPSTAGTVVGTVRLPTGLLFDAVPDGVSLSADRRTATYLVATLPNGAVKRLDLRVRALANATVGKLAVTGSAGTALVADPTRGNNTFGARIVVR